MKFMDEMNETPNMDCWFRTPAGKLRQSYLLPCYWVWSIPPFCLGHTGVCLFQIWNGTFTKMQEDEFRRIHVRRERQHKTKRADWWLPADISVLATQSGVFFMWASLFPLLQNKMQSFSRVFQGKGWKRQNLPMESDDLWLIDRFN